MKKTKHVVAFLCLQWCIPIWNAYLSWHWVGLPRTVYLVYGRCLSMCSGDVVYYVIARRAVVECYQQSCSSIMAGGSCPSQRGFAYCHLPSPPPFPAPTLRRSFAYLFQANIIQKIRVYRRQSCPKIKVFWRQTWPNTNGFCRQTWPTNKCFLYANMTKISVFCRQTWPKIMVYCRQALPKICVFSVGKHYPQ